MSAVSYWMVNSENDELVHMSFVTHSSQHCFSIHKQPICTNIMLRHTGLTMNMLQEKIELHGQRFRTCWGVYICNNIWIQANIITMSFLNFNQPQQSAL